MQISEIPTLVSSCSPITLEEMDSVKLMNRFDTKYVFSSSRLPEFFAHLQGNYKILEIAGERSFRYNTLYLDTPGYLFYNQHVTGKLSRHKVRYRTYELSGITYLEVKRKTNQNRTIKWRIRKNQESGSNDAESTEFIEKHVPYKENLDLHPVMRNGFRRITMVGVDTHERITIDFDVDFQAYNGTSITLPFIAIVEHKSEAFACHSPFRSAVLQTGIHPMGFSKYCIGNALLLDIPRKNILKQRLLLIKKIENDYFKSSGS